MPARHDRAVAVTRTALHLAVVPVAATLASLSKVARALAAGPGGGVTFPFPTGLPTLWTYASLPSRGGVATGPLSLVTFVPVFALGVLVTGALEAGFLGALWGRIEGDTAGFLEGVERFGVRLVGVNLLRAAVVFAIFPLIAVPPLAMLVALVLTYFLYGHPFEVVVRDAGVLAALRATLDRASEGGEYAAFGLAHLVGGALASLVLSSVVRTGVVGVLLGAASVAVPAVYVATYGLLLFHEMERAETTTSPG